MGIFGLSFRKEKPLPWPKDEAGELILPVLLKSIRNNDMEVDIILNMLKSYGIPTDKRQKAAVVDIFVPETMIDTATDLINADIVDE